MTAHTPTPPGHSHYTLPPAHLLLALSIAFVWGTNFVVVKYILAEWPPMFTAFMRYVVCFLPAAFFLKHPKVPIWNIATYGILVGPGQFGLVYWAMDGMISPGLTSVIIQTQVFFTVILAIIFEGERLKQFQWVALGLVGIGVLVIALNTYDGASGGETTALGLAMVMFAAFLWAVSNTVVKRNGRINMLAFVVWASMYSLPPLFALSYFVDGPEVMWTAFTSTGPFIWSAVIWQTIGNTMFGFAMWGWLLARHPSAAVAPMALLVPVLGISTSAVLLNEPLQTWKLSAAALIIAGLSLNTLWPRLMHWCTQPAMRIPPSA